MPAKVEIEEVEEAVPEHECKGAPTTYLSEPLFNGYFTDGEEYMGQHVYYELRCHKCDWVLKEVTHAGPCFSPQELELMGSHWSVKHEQFIFKRGEAPQWRAWNISDEAKQEIAGYYRGWNDMPKKLSRVLQLTF